MTIVREEENGDNGGLLAPVQYGAAAWPLVSEQQRLPRNVFRRSIAWLSNSLSTLRSQYGSPTPHLRLASSRWEDTTGRAFHPQDSFEKFQSASYISFSFPKLAWRNLIDRSAQIACSMLRCRRTEARNATVASSGHRRRSGV
jgi:hypothetical protein